MTKIKARPPAKTRAPAKGTDEALRRKLRLLAAENKKLKALLTANNIIWGG